MGKPRFLIVTMVALAAASCARQQQTSADGNRGLFAQSFAQPQYAQQTYQQPVPPSRRGLSASQVSVPQPQASTGGDRGLFASQGSAQQPYVVQYTPPRVSAPRPAAPNGAYASVSPYEQPYTLDAGDKLRIVVFGQDGISNAYIVDAGGNVNLPLVGTVPARGATTQQLSQRIAERLKQGYVREPHVTVEVEAYRPFFILGEVTNPGQYPYVADMTVEKAIAIAGGFAPRASKGNVEITRNVPGQQFKGQVPLTYPMRPGDTVVVKERWF
jgi:polysaccharide export outer membrane protein